MEKETTRRVSGATEAVGDSVTEGCEPVMLYRSLTWAFLPPALAAALYGVLDVFTGLGSGTAMLISALFVMALVFSPEKTCPDWCGVCFTTGAVGLFVFGHPVSYVFGGIAILFAVMTALDESSTLTLKKRLALLGIYALTAGLASIAYLIAVWATLVLAVLYAFFYLTLKHLLPFGLAARASLKD